MNAIFEWLIESGWQTAIMFTVISLILVLAGKKIPPGWRYALLFLVVIRMLMPALPETKVSAYRVVPDSPAKAWEQALPQEPTPAWMVQGGIKSPSANSSLTPWPTERLVSWVWLAGVLICFTWVLAHQLLFFLQFRKTKRTPSEKVKTILASAAKKAGLRHAPPVWEMDGIDGPALSGLIFPSIVLPLDLEQPLEPGRLELVLLHECVHLRRMDAWTHSFSILAWTLHWWNPLAWWLMKKLHAERELATDAAVLALLDDSEQRNYGDTLIGLALKHQGRLSLFQPSLGILEKHGDLRKRMTQIAGFSRTSVVWSILCGGLLAALAFLLLAKESSVPLEPIPKDTQTRERLLEDFSQQVRKGNLKAVETYLRRGLDVNSHDALFGAVSRENEPMVRLLLAHGAAVEQKTSWGGPSNLPRLLDG